MSGVAFILHYVIVYQSYFQPLTLQMTQGKTNMKGDGQRSPWAIRIYSEQKTAPFGRCCFQILYFETTKAGSFSALNSRWQSLADRRGDPCWRQGRGDLDPVFDGEALGSGEKLDAVSEGKKESQGGRVIMQHGSMHCKAARVQDGCSLVAAENAASLLMGFWELDLQKGHSNKASTLWTSASVSECDQVPPDLPWLQMNSYKATQALKALCGWTCARPRQKPSARAPISGESLILAGNVEAWYSNCNVLDPKGSRTELVRGISSVKGHLQCTIVWHCWGLPSYSRS